MGCFSFLCKECGKGIKSNSFTGEPCRLFLLKEGKVVQEMKGQYDSYGRCFIPGSQRKDVQHKLKESYDWKDPSPDTGLDKDTVRICGTKTAVWHKVTDLMHGNDKRSGIAALHKKCFEKIPTTRSENDPNQGWGDDEEDLMGNTDPNHKYE